MWHIPAEVLKSNDDQDAIDYVLDQLKYPDVFVSKVKQLYSDPEAVTYDLLEFNDGRIWFSSIPGEGSLLNFTIPYIKKGE